MSSSGPPTPVTRSFQALGRGVGRQKAPVHPTHGAAIGQLCAFEGQLLHAVFGQSRLDQTRFQHFFAGCLKRWHYRWAPGGLGEATHDRLALLAEIEPRDHTGGTEDEFYRHTIGQLRHVGVGQDARHHPFGTVAVAHAVAHPHCGGKIHPRRGRFAND